MRRILVAVCLAAAVADAAPLAANRQACGVTVPAWPKLANIFSFSQESDLGDVIAEAIEPLLGPIEDRKLSDHLRSVGQRLVKQLPPTELRIQFTVIDLPDANAFTLPGGRIYVTRKMIGFTRSEDELAGVLAHELGHLLARQQAVSMTQRLKEVLNVTEVGDREDIRAKFHRLLDNAARHPERATESHEAAWQIEADRLGLLVTAAAGYDPLVMEGFLNRLVATGDQRRGFFARLFGLPTPDAKRTAAMARTAATLPAGCTRPAPPASADAYRRWQVAVAAFNGTGRTEDLRGVVRSQKLAPFRGELSHVRFSPDGRHVLAQDEAGITVLTRDPFGIHFRVDTPDARPATFSSDSASLLFHTPFLRVERWDLASRSIADVRDLVRATPCTVTELSPDGRVIACVDLSSDLVLLDVATGAPVFQRKAFYKENDNDAMFSFMGMMRGTNTRRSGELTLRFSPDGRFFAAGFLSFGGKGALVYDLTTRAEIPLKGNARSIANGFVFIGPDRLLGLNAAEPAKSGIIQLPAGTIATEVPLPLGLLDSSANPQFILIRPYERFAVGIYDLTARAVVRGLETSAVDLFDTFWVTERGLTDIGLFGADARMLSSTTLPASALWNLRAAAVSRDFRWLAVSEQTRGVIWDVAGGRRVAHVRDFDGAFMDEAGVLFADLPKAGAEPRAIMRYDSPARRISNAGDIHDPLARQFGRWMAHLRINIQDRTGPSLEIDWRDIPENRSLWSRRFQREFPDFLGADQTTDALVVGFKVDTPAGRSRVNQDPALRSRVRQDTAKGDYVLDVIDAATGKDRGRVLIETGKASFDLLDAVAAGDHLALSDSLGRVLLYSVSTGELKGYAFGFEPVISAPAGVMLLGTDTGRVAVHDLATMQVRDRLTFRHRVAHKALSADGRQFFVLTGDQIGHVLQIAR